MSGAADAGAAVARLDELTRHLRLACPWDREQDAQTIVPHTVEEAYELADAANSGDDERLLDELGDVLFQVHFLSLLLEERGAGSLAQVAEHVRTKLVHRHPHVFTELEVADAGEVLANWDAIKQGEAGREPGIFGEVPENLPGPLYARKLQRRAATAGVDHDDPPFAAAVEATGRVQTAAGDRDAGFAAVGDALFAAVDVARKLKVDPELALRAAADRFRASVEDAEALSEQAGVAWDDASTEQRRQFHAEARSRQP